MRKFLLAFALASAAPMALGGCATLTAGNVQMSADKAFLSAQVAFHSLQQIATAGIKSGAITGTRKNQIIDLIVKGQEYENTAYQTRNSASIAALAGTVQALANLGLGKD